MFGLRYKLLAGLASLLIILTAVTLLANSVLWRYSTGGKNAILQKPPTAQNYAIGTKGPVTSNGPFAGGPGFVEAITGELAPHSLYEGQLCDRLTRAQGGR